MGIRSRSRKGSTVVFLTPRPPERNSGVGNSEETSESTPERLAALARAFVGVVGLSGVLYAIGFASLQARYSLLGISEKVAWSNADVATEGGRFLYQLAFVVADLLLPVTPAVAIATILLAGVGQCVRLKRPRRALPKAVDKARPWLTAAAVAAGLLITLALLDTPAQAARWHDLLRAKSVPPFPQNEYERSRLFAGIELRALVSVAIGLGFSRLWAGATAAWRAIISAQWFAALAQILLLPVAFGKLMSTFEYPRIEYPAANASDVLVLIGRSDDAWVVWDCGRRQTKLVPTGDKHPVTLGERINLLRFAPNDKEAAK